MQVQSAKVAQLREGLRTNNWDEFRLFVRRQMAEQNGRVKASPQMADAARKELGPGGHWSPEAVADRIVEFAKGLAGDDPEKQKMVVEAFRKGFAEAEKVLGALPEVSFKTRDRVEEKFREWLK